MHPGKSRSIAGVQRSHVKETLNSWIYTKMKCGHLSKGLQKDLLVRLRVVRSDPEAVDKFRGYFQTPMCLQGTHDRAYKKGKSTHLRVVLRCVHAHRYIHAQHVCITAAH